MSSVIDFLLSKPIYLLVSIILIISSLRIIYLIKEYKKLNYNSSRVIAKITIFDKGGEDEPSGFKYEFKATNGEVYNGMIRTSNKSLYKVEDEVVIIYNHLSPSINTLPEDLKKTIAGYKLDLVVLTIMIILPLVFLF